MESNRVLSSLEEQIQKDFIAHRKVKVGKRARPYSKALKDLCQKALEQGISFKQLANLSGVTRETLRKWHLEPRTESVQEAKGSQIQVLKVIKPNVIVTPALVFEVGKVRIEVYGGAAL